MTPFDISTYGFTCQTGVSMNLSEIKKNVPYTVERVESDNEVITSRFYKLGFYAGACITLLRKAPLFGDPLLFEVGESQIALTKVEAKLIQVIKK